MKRILAVLVTVLFLLNVGAVGLAAEPTATNTTTTATTTTTDTGATSSGALSASTGTDTTSNPALDSSEDREEPEKEAPETGEKPEKKERKENQERKERRERRLKLKLEEEEEEEAVAEAEAKDPAKRQEHLLKVQSELDKAMRVLAENQSSIKAKEAVLRAHLRAEALLQSGENWAAALKLAQTIIAADPTNQAATLVLAKDLYDQGKTDEALQLLKGFLAQKPGEKGEILEKMGEILEAKGDLPEAEKSLEESLSLKPTVKRLYEKLGRVLEEKGEKGLKVFVEGKRPDFDVQPQLINGRSMVPFRKVGEALGAKVDWEAATQTVIAERKGIRVVLPVGSLTIYINGKPQTIDVPAQLVGGRTLVPVRFLSQALGATVDWNDTYQMVIVTDTPPAPAATGQ
ncbi:MAG: stalk domain-containing protein [Firmicutes bacterium]|nr:stalk domain-containing protein [Bacillota bacterium]MCL5039807.1 stalk domain-containing protein [Bacillota bacterium]